MSTHSSRHTTLLAVWLATAYLVCAQSDSELGLKSEVTAAAPAGRLTLTHTVWNPSSETATNVWLTNQLPAGVSFHATNKWPVPSTGPTYPEPQLPPMTLAPIKPGVTFDSPWTVTNPPAVAIAIADLDDDGWPDLVVGQGTNASGFVVWKNAGTNSPSSPRPRFTATGTFSDGNIENLTIGDFNGDGRPDVVVAEVGRNVLKTYFQTGDIPTQPQFVLGTSNGFSNPITGIVVMDFDGDGFDDLAVLEPAAAKVHMLHNGSAMGAPGFVEVGTLDTPPSPTALGKEKKRPGRESPTLASLGRLFVTSDSGGGAVTVFVPSGSADFANLYLPALQYPCGSTPRAIAVGDLDGDGVEDLVVANGAGRSVTLLRGEGSGSYTLVGSKVCDAGAAVNAVRLLDLDGDGRPEILTGSAGLNDCIIIPNSRTTKPLSADQFGIPVHFDLPAPFRRMGFDASRDGSWAGDFIVVGHAGPNQGSLPGGQSFTVLGLTQPGAELAVPLGDLAPGESTGISLELEVRVPDATNTATASAKGVGPGTPVVTPIKIPLGTVCGSLFCVSGGLTQGMGGFSVTVAINGTGYHFTNSTVTMPDGSYCLQLPFSCGGVFPWDTTITVTTPACPGQSWVFPINVLFAYMTIPPVYCSNCTACKNVQNVLSLFSGRNSSGPLPVGSLDPQFVTGIPPFSTVNPYVTTAAPGWMPNGPNSKWVGPDPAFQSFAGVYCYTNTFYLPCTNNAQIGGQWTVAGSGAEVLLNGLPTGISLSGFGLEANWYPLNVTSGFVVGWNTLIFCVTNPPSSDGTAFSPTGLRTELTGRAVCCAGCAEIHCPSNIVAEICTNGPAPYGQVVTYPAPAAFSHCGVITNIVCIPPSGTFFGLGTNLVTCVAYDSLGNVAQCSFSVIVRPDFTPPTVLQCPPLYLTVTGCPPAMPNLTTNVVAVDNCTPPNQLSITQTIPPGTPLPPGQTTVIVSVCDAAGNCHDCDVIVTAIPTGNAPILTCPPNQVLYTCGSNVAAFYQATAYGNAGSILCSPPSGTLFPLGTNTVTCSATNACGVISTCTFQVIVKPTLLGPPSATFLAGLPDNFAPPIEPSPSNTCMVAAFSGYLGWKGFDDTTINKLVGHRFTGLPGNIVKAELEIRMVPGANDGSDNDGLFVGLPACNFTNFLWSASIKTLPGAGGSWLPGHPATTFTLDLGALNPALLAHMNAMQRLDVVVHDDTTVDYMRLRLWTCAPPKNPNGPPHWVNFGTNRPSTLAAVATPELPAFGPIGNGPAMVISPPEGDPSQPNTVQLGLGGGQAFGFTTILDMNAPEGSQVVISVPTDDGTNTPLFSIVKGKCPPRCNWDLKANKKFFDGGGGAARVAAVNTNGDLLDAFVVSEAEADSDSLLSLVSEPGVDEFPVSFLFDWTKGHITVTFPGAVARRLCNGLPCPRGWDGTIKGRIDEGARRKGWDGTVKCPCYDENASRVICMPSGNPPQIPVPTLEISSIGLNQLILTGEHLYTMGVDAEGASDAPANLQSTEPGDGVSFSALHGPGGANLSLGLVSSFDIGFQHTETSNASPAELLFRLGGPKWPPGTTTNRPPPPPIDVRIVKGTNGIESYVDFHTLELTNVNVQLWNNGVLVALGTWDGNSLSTDPLVTSDWPDNLHFLGVQDGLRLTKDMPFEIDGFVGDELRVWPTLLPEAQVPYAFTELDCLGNEGTEWLVHSLRTTSAVPPAPLSIEGKSNAISVSWDAEGFHLQGADSLDGPWLDLGVDSPAVLNGNGNERYFRLSNE